MDNEKKNNNDNTKKNKILLEIIMKIKKDKFIYIIL